MIRFLLVGLGNIGMQYENTRHNAGFMWIDKLYDFLGNSTSYEVTDWQLHSKFRGYFSEVRLLGGHGSKLYAVLLKPSTYMNASGIAVQKFVRFYKLFDNKQVVIAYDDLDIKLGAYKISSTKSPRQHNGILSVQSHLGTGFWNVRLGIESRDSIARQRIEGKKYVLQKIATAELDLLSQAINDSIHSLRKMLEL